MWLKSFVERLKPVDITTFIYLFVTTALMLIFPSELSGLGLHLLLRLLIIAFVVTLIQYKGESKLMHFSRDMYPMLLLMFFYPETDFLNNIFFNNLDPWFAGAEQKLWGCQPSLVFSQLMPWRWFAELMHFAYFSYYILIFALMLWIYYKNRKVFDYAGNIIYTSFYLFYVLFIVIPVAGPQFYYTGAEGSVPQGYVFGSLMKLIHHFGEGPTAAFPSSHVGIMVVMWWLCYRFAKPLLPYFVAVGIVLILSTVYLKAHYLIDVLAGFIVAPVFYKVCARIYFRLTGKKEE